MQNYLYNKKTHTLHIAGLCARQSNPNCNSDWLGFSSEQQAYALDGNAVHMCMLCQKSREKLIKEKNL